MMRTDARWLLAVIAALLAMAAPAHAVYHLAGTIDLDASSANYGFDDAPMAAFAVDQQGNVYVLNKSAPWITKYSPTGQRLVQFGSADQVEEPKGIATDAAGGVYVSDDSKVDDTAGIVGQVIVFSTAGSYQRAISYEDPLYGPGSGFTVDGTGHVYITDTDTQIIDGSGKKTGTVPYGRVDATDMGAIAGNPSGSGVFGRSNFSQGEAIFTFDAAGTELGKLTTPSSSSGDFNWHPDRLTANTKGELIILDRYCRAAVVFVGGKVTDAAFLGSLITPGKKADFSGPVGTDAAGDIFVEVAWGDGSFRIARLVPGSGSSNLPQKACRALPGAGTTTGGGTTGGGTTTAASPQFSLPPQTLQNRTFLLGLSCASACSATVTAKAIVGAKKYKAGRKSARLAAGGSGTIEVKIPKRTYRRIVRRLQGGKAAKLRVSLKVSYADGRMFSKKVTLPLTPASG